MNLHSGNPVLFTLALLLILPGSHQKVQAQRADAIIDTLTQARINRIENSLYPIYNLRGQEKARSIPEMMRESNIVGLSMAFVDHGKIAWTKCYGYADLEDSVKMTPDKIFRAASLSKPVTAMAALKMAEKGQLQLDQDINQQLKGWKLPENEYTKDQKVTAALIIGHRSGIKNDVHEGLASSETMPSQEDLFSGKTPHAPVAVISVPGERYKYSNLGYMVLAELLADISGKDFPTLMEQLVLKPCKMTSSTFEQELPESLRNRIATGHDENGHALAYYKHSSTGAGALWTTPGDLGLFMAEILGAYHHPDQHGKVISHEMAKRVFERSDEKLGFNKNTSDHSFVVRNDGSIPGYNCTLMGSLTKNQAVVLMLNTGSNDAYDFLNYLWRAVSLEYNWGLFEPHFYETIELSDESLRKFEGHYSDQNEGFHITAQKGQLQVLSAETGTRQAVPIGKTAFLIPEIPMRLGFETDSLGMPIKLYVRDSGGNGHAAYARQR